MQFNAIASNDKMLMKLWHTTETYLRRLGILFRQAGTVVKFCYSAVEIFRINYFVFLLRTNGSPGAKTIIRSGFFTLSFKRFGSPLKGAKSGASTNPQ